MLAQVKARVKTLHPDALFTTTFQSRVVLRLRTTYAPIVNVLDHVAFTYYPIGPSFAVLPETSIVGDLPVMIAAARPLPVYFAEIGYPTSALLGGSPERQRDFVRIAFDTIRAAGTSQVLGATYLFQADLPEWLLTEISAASGNESDAFRAFVGTLGLRDERDRPRPGWDEFVRQAALVGPPMD